MIEVYFNTNDERYVWASDLHKCLQIGTKLNTWFPRMIEWGFEENKDFFRRHKSVTSANSMEKALFDWAMTLDMAKHIAMTQKTPIGKQIRNYLLSLDKQVTDGEFLNHAQIQALFEICKVMGFFSLQQFFKEEHFKKLFANRKHEWWDNRARLFGYTRQELKDALMELGKKYKNMEQAMLAIDKNNLIRMGVMDLFLALGKSKAYAQNIGNVAKTIADQIKPDIYNDIDTLIDFKSEEQKLLITDLKNYKTEGSNILQNFSKGLKPKRQVTTPYSQLDFKLNQN